MQQQQQQQEQQQQRAQSFAALWSLDPSYNEQEVEEALEAIGFNPEHVSKLGEGAFGLAFGDVHSGVAFSLALDGIDPKRGVLKYRDEGVRVAPWRSRNSQEPRSLLEPWDMPEDLVCLLEEFAEKVIKKCLLLVCKVTLASYVCRVACSLWRDIICVAVA